MSMHERSGISRATYDRYPGRERVRTPAGRAVAIVLLAVATVVVVWGVAEAAVVPIVVGLVLWIPAMGMVNTVAGGLTAMRTTELDERELERREHASALAHRVVGGLLVAGVIVASAVLPERVASTSVVAGAIAILFVHIASPSLVLAMTSRLPDRV